MKVEFEKEYLRDLYETGKTTDKKHRFQPQVVNGYVKCVKALQKVIRMEDLFLIKSLNYEKLKGDKKRLSSVRINDQYRLEFREISNPDYMLVGMQTDYNLQVAKKDKSILDRLESIRKFAAML